MLGAPRSGSSGGAVGEGGGMASHDGSSPVLTNCTFTSNSAGSHGGGMENHGNSSPALTHCTFAGNSAVQGGGIYNYDRGNPVLTNTILWGDIPDAIGSEFNSSPTVTYSDIQGGYSGEGNIEADPMLVDPGNADFHLGPGSPCVDAGDNTAPNLPPYDFEGDDRILDGNHDGTAIVDMGVDEAIFLRVYLPLVLRSY